MDEFIREFKMLQNLLLKLKERVDNVLADKEIEIQLLREEMDRTREEKEALLERLRRLGDEGGAEVERRLQK